jgi:hypothetical protein
MRPALSRHGRTDRKAKQKRRRHTYDYGRPGRPKVKVGSTPPKGFKLHLNLMKRLDARGWYRQLEERRQLEGAESDPRDPDDQRLRRVTDPDELDRMMCRTDVVAVCNTADDMKVAHFNGRLVLEVDPLCPPELVFQKIAIVLKQARRSTPRRINTKPWVHHRILALYDLRLLGYNLTKERKQLALWLFAEIRNEKARGHKFDRAKKYLDEALSSLTTLRAQSSR